MLIDVENGTAGAALAGRDALARLAHGSVADERRMAKVARAALFEEALLGALHARLNELRSVTK
ncbi:MAG: hypothetical protein ABR591_15090 [Candidatus Velthaea sp.]